MQRAPRGCVRLLTCLLQKQSALLINIQDEINATATGESCTHQIFPFHSLAHIASFVAHKVNGV